MNNLDKQYTDLLQDILDNGVTKSDRTGTGTLSIFGRQIRHKMSEGFPLLTTKKMPFKTIVTELLWFLRGDTNIKFLVDNNCHIWDGDAYKNYEKWWKSYSPGGAPIPLSKEEFINRIKTDDEFAKKWGDLGPIYGKQWRDWLNLKWEATDKADPSHPDRPMLKWKLEGIDQISYLIHDLKTNPDSRRLMVNAWNVGELDQMVLPPCHYGFQVYTRELSLEERAKWLEDNKGYDLLVGNLDHDHIREVVEEEAPTRAISLMWNQRSVDTFLGLPFNIASYGLLLEIIAKAVNMVPEELIGNLGDTHLYSNHIEQAKEQIGREYDHEERHEMLKTAMGDFYKTAVDEQVPFSGGLSEYYESYNIPQRTREPYPLPTLNINTEFWLYEGGECGEGPLDAIAVMNGFKDDHFCKCLLEEDLQLANYQSHPTIKAPLSN
jgi:thymidylate synthase